MKELSIAIDGGHSMFKVRAALSSAPTQRITFQIPTVVMPAIAISNEQTRIRAEFETIDLDGSMHFFGETALRQMRSEIFTGQHANWIESNQHDVLILGAWRKVMNEIGEGAARIMLVMVSDKPAALFSKPDPVSTMTPCSMRWEMGDGDFEDRKPQGQGMA